MRSSMSIRGGAAMTQQGQVFELRGRGGDSRTVWAYRYRVGGRGSRRVQRGGFESEQAAAEALERALERLRREQGLVEAPRLSELVDVYLAQHDGEPETVEKLRWLLAKAVGSFGHRRISRLRPAEIAAWRMTILPGHRFEATQALRQVLARAVSWGLIDMNPAKQGVDNPQRRRTEKRPFESWAELEALATELGPRYGPLVLFAAATGTSGRVDRARAPGHRSRCACRLCASRISEWESQVAEDGGEHSRRAAAGDRDRCA
jgi:hypothetical protein